MAYEIKDAIQAIGSFAGGAAPLGGAAVITQSGFRSFVRSGVGLYTLELDGAIAPRAGAVVGIPKAGSIAAISGVCTGATVELVSTNPATGAPVDCPLFDLVVYREPTGTDPTAALPAPPAPSPLDSENLVQFFNEFPVGSQGVNRSAPVFTSRAVDRFLFNIFFPPPAGETIGVFLNRARNPPGGPFTFTQIAPTYTITDADPSGQWVDLSSTLLPSAADYDQGPTSNDLLILTTIASGGVGLAVLLTVVGFQA